MRLFSIGKKLKGWVVCTLFVASMGTNSAAYAYCATQDEMQALNSSVLVSELMVAALSCGQQKQYNRYVNKFNKALISNNLNLKGYFDRHYGQKAEFEMNRFITRIANLSSRASLKQPREEYCGSTNQLFKESMAAAEPTNISKAEISKLSETHGVPLCGKGFSFRDLFSRNTYSAE